MKNNPASNHLLSIINTVKENAENVQSDAHNISSNMQYIVDVSNAIIPLVPDMNNGLIEEVDVIYSEALKQTEYSLRSIKEVNSSSDSTAGTISITASSISSFINGIPVSISINSSVDNRWNNFISVISRPELKDEVERLMKIFRLDIPPSGKQSSFELFRIAYQAYESPVLDSSPAITSLIPMREAVTSAINELLRLRPRQEFTGRSDKKKIISIATQLRKDIISDNVVQEWADQWHDINDSDLSYSKENRITRDEWGRKLNRATLFLHGLLTGLDPTRIQKEK